MKSLTTIKENELVSQLRDGDSRAFDFLYQQYSKTIFNYSLRFLKQNELAEEIVQEVFLKIWMNRHSLNPDLSFKSFLFTIAKNLIFNFHKKASNDLRLQEQIYHIRSEENSCFVEDEIDWQDYQRIKNNAINSLPKRRREVFLLSREENLSNKEISERLNISVITVRNQLSIAVNDIRNYLEAHGDVTLMILFTVKFL